MNSILEEIKNIEAKLREMKYASLDITTQLSMLRTILELQTLILKADAEKHLRNYMNEATAMNKRFLEIREQDRPSRN